MNVSTHLHTGRAPSRQEVAAAALIAAAFVVIPVYAVECAARQASIPPLWLDRIGGATLMVDFMLAALMCGQGIITRRLRAFRLGMAYLVAGSLLAAGFIAGPEAAWPWSVGHVGFALAVMRQGTTRGDGQAPSTWRSSRALIAVLGYALAAALLLRLSIAMLPTMREAATGFTTIVATLTALLLVLRRRLREPTDLWLAVALTAAFVDAWIGPNAAGGATIAALAQASGLLAGGLGLLVCQLRDQGARFRHLTAANVTLERMAHRDGLTGLSNRRHLDETLRAEWRRAQRDARPLSMLLIDVDHFKDFNDIYGHLLGDECLKVVAEQIRGMARRGGDLAARYGGEEFALVLPATELGGATVIARELTRAVRAQTIPHDGSSKEIVTVSIGVACARPRLGETFDGLVARADAALYQAKHRGRDQVHTDGTVDADPAGLASIPGFGPRPVDP